MKEALRCYCGQLQAKPEKTLDDLEKPLKKCAWCGHVVSWQIPRDGESTN